MKLYLLSQTENEGYNTYDSAVVVAEDEVSAKEIVPGGYGWSDKYSPWATSPSRVTAKYIGEAAEGVHGVICASFNAR